MPQYRITNYDDAVGGGIGSPSQPLRTDPTGTTLQPVYSAGEGNPSDAAWSGTGDASIISLFKRLATIMSSALNVRGGTAVDWLAVRLTDGTNFLSGLSVAVTSTVATLRTVNHIGAASMTDAVMNGLTALTPKYAAIAAVTAGNNQLVAAVTSKKIRVLALDFISVSANNMYFTSSNGGTVIHGGSTNKMQFGANSGIVLPFNPVGWFETVAGEALVLNLSGATAVSGGVTYIEV